MKKILIAIMALATAACSSPAPNFFQPVAVKTTDATYPGVKGMVLVGQVLLPAEQARPQITTLGEENYQVRIDEFNRWGASPERLVQRVLNEDLGMLLPNAMIENQTTLKKNYKYAVTVEILDMSGRLDEMAALKASYFIRSKQGKILKQGRFDRRTEIDGSYDAYIPAQSRLIGDLAQVIACLLYTSDAAVEL